MDADGRRCRGEMKPMDGLRGDFLGVLVEAAATKRNAGFQRAIEPFRDNSYRSIPPLIPPGLWLPTGFYGGCAGIHGSGKHA